jgi:hypothetical protein
MFLTSSDSNSILKSGKRFWSTKASEKFWTTKVK